MIYVVSREQSSMLLAILEATLLWSIPINLLQSFKNWTAGFNIWKKQYFMFYLSTFVFFS